MVEAAFSASSDILTTAPTSASEFNRVVNSPRQFQLYRFYNVSTSFVQGGNVPRLDDPFLAVITASTESPRLLGRRGAASEAQSTSTTPIDERNTELIVAVNQIRLVMQAADADEDGALEASAALRALFSRFDASAAANAVMDLLASSEPSVWLALLSGLAELRERSRLAASVAEAGLGHTRSDIRYAAMLALAQLRSPITADALADAARREPIAWLRRDMERLAALLRE